MSRARDVALKTLIRVEREKAFAAAVLTFEMQGKIDSRDAALATELVLGVLRWLPWLDHLLESASERGLKKLEPTARQILRLAAYQIAFLDRIPRRAAVAEALKQIQRSGAPGLSGLANGVLRNLSTRDQSALRPAGAGDPPSPDGLALRVGQPTWLLQRLIQAYGLQRTREITAAFNQPSRRTMRVNENRISRDQLLSELGAEATVGKLSPWALDLPSPTRAKQLEEDGLAAYQDEGAQLVALAVDPRPGQRILDACAGRGVKTAALAMSCSGQVKVAATDRMSNKIETLRFAMDRLGCDVETALWDLTAGPCPLSGKFDRVLVDAPCSGSGTLGRRPEIRWRITPEDVEALTRIQAKLLEGACALVAPGGRLVYAVCSLLPAEGLEQRRRFLEDHREFRPVLQPPRHWPKEVAWADGLALLDPAAHLTDGYALFSVEREPA